MNQLIYIYDHWSILSSRTIGWLPPIKGKDELLLFCGNGQRLITLYVAHHSCQIHWAPLWVFTWNIISISCFHLKETSCPRNGSDVRLLRVSCVECLVGENTTNQSLIEICNGCLYLVLYWQDILGLVCGTWYDLAKRYVIIWYVPAS